MYRKRSKQASRQASKQTNKKQSCSRSVSKSKQSILLSPPSSSKALKHGTCLLTLKKSIQAFETKCLEKLLRIFYLEHTTNDWVWSKINFLLGPQEPLLPTAKRRKFAWFGQVTRHDSLSKTILQDTLEGGRRRGRQRKCWMDNIKD